MQTNPMNNKSTIVGYVDAVVYILTILAGLPYALGDVSTIIAPEWKVRILITGLIAGAILKVIKGHVTEDAQKPQFASSIISKMTIFLLVGMTAVLCGCAMSQLTKDKWAATGSIVGPKIASLAGQFLVASIGAQISHNDANYLDSAAQGARTLKINGTGEDIGNLFRIWSKKDDRFDKLADSVEQVATKEIAKGVPPQVVAEQIAMGLNGAAASAR